MLFRTVYGQELEAIYQYIRNWDEGVVRQKIVGAFIPTSQEANVIISPQNVEDTLSFLTSSYLLEEQDNVFRAVAIDLPFKLALLQNLRQIELGALVSKHPLDSMFFALINELFVMPNEIFADNLHTRTNNIDGIKLQGGVSKEKIQAWKRVMEYLGLGYRVQSGFMCVIHPDLLQKILLTMPERSSTLQHFFEQYVSRFLPYLNRSGDASQAIREPMLYLNKADVIKLTQLQDSPSKAYFQPHNLRFIMRESNYASI